MYKKRKIGTIFGQGNCMNHLLSHEVAKEKIGLFRFILKYPLIIATKFLGFPPHIHDRDYENVVFDFLVNGNPKTFLDIGSGYGRWALSVCKETGATGICVDRDNRDLATVKSVSTELGLSCICIEEDILKCKFEKDQFDLIYIIEAMHIISDDRKLLKLIYSWLKPQGRFVFQSPFHFKQMAFSSDHRFGAIRNGYSQKLFEEINNGLFDFEYYTIGKRKECKWCPDNTNTFHPLKLIGIGVKI